MEVIMWYTLNLHSAVCRYISIKLKKMQILRPDPRTMASETPLGTGSAICALAPPGTVIQP